MDRFMIFSVVAASVAVGSVLIYNYFYDVQDVVTDAALLDYKKKSKAPPAPQAVKTKALPIDAPTIQPPPVKVAPTPWTNADDEAGSNDRFYN